MVGFFSGERRDAARADVGRRPAQLVVTDRPEWRVRATYPDDISIERALAGRLVEDDSNAALPSASSRSASGGRAVAELLAQGR